MPKLEHPDLDTVIDVPESAVPIHMASGWHPVADEVPQGVPSTSNKSARGVAAAKDKE